MKNLNLLWSKIFQSQTIKNSAWGIVANILQTIFVSLFFVILARKYASADFAQFLIASTVYQIIVAFSSMGLGSWFIREFDQETDKAGFTSKFIKIQTGLGLLFYLVNIGLAFVLYPGGQIRWLCIILGSNIIFDNIIYAIKNLNVAELEQKKTFKVLVIDGFLRLVLGCLLFIYPFSITSLSVLLIILRFLTVNLFIKMGSSNNMDIRNIWYSNVSWSDLKKQIIQNWQFVVIGSVSIIYWRIANVIIAKTLTLKDVADYEISFRVLSISMILPTIASATIYSQYVKYYNAGDTGMQKRFYKRLFLAFNFFAVFSYAFIYSFSDVLLPYAFGEQYATAVPCLKQMFLTMLVLSTVLLQASVIVAMKHERIDMFLNIFSLLIYMAGCLIGLAYSKSLSVVTYSIFASFLVFHISQNIFLIKQGITNFKSCFLFYLLLLVFVLGYQYLADTYNPYAVFVLFSVFTGIVLIGTFYNHQKNSTYPIDDLKTPHFK